MRFVIPRGCPTVRFAAYTAASLLASLVLAKVSPAASTASDNAGNYTSWTNGSNGGNGFGAWNLSVNSNDGSGNYGYFLGDSTAGAGNVNTNGQSFGIYAHTSTYADASRTLNSALSVGQTFSIQISVAYRNGDKGFNLLSSGTQVFNFDVGQSGTGTDGYYYMVGSGSAVSTGFAYYADSVFTLAYTQQSATAGMFIISRTSASGGVAASNSVSVPFTASGVNSFVLYNSNTTDGTNPNNLYFNNLLVVPEPAAIWLLGLGLAALVVTRRRSGSTRRA